MKKSVSVIGTVGIPACYGGFESLVENLTKYNSGNIKYHIYCSSKSYSNELVEHNNARLHYVNLQANGVQSIPYDIISLIKSLNLKTDVTLILGVSGCLFLPIFKLFSKSKIVTNIDGLEWKRDKWGFFAKKFLKLSEKIAVKYSNIIIADNKAISDYVFDEYDVEAVTIAYGGDHVLTGTFTDNKVDDSYYLSLCRIEPENNVEMILNSFSKQKKALVFIGNWDKSTYGLELKNKYSKFSNISIVDPVYDLSALFEYRNNCAGYIHGHSAGGTNPSLVEAMHFEKPIYAFDCNFNRYSTDSKAFYFSTSDELILKLESYNEQDITENATSMKDIANARYTWQVIASEYESLYY